MQPPLHPCFAISHTCHAHHHAQLGDASLEPQLTTSDLDSWLCTT